MPVHRALVGSAAALALVASLLPIAAAEDAAEEVVFDTPPSVTHQVAPEYPKDRRHVSGRVLIELTVTVDGEAAELEVLEGIEGHPEFSDAASAALAQWQFSPARKDGKPVAARIVVPFKFEPREKKAREAEAPDR